MKKRSLLLHYLASALLAAGAFYAGWAAKESGNETTRSDGKDLQVIRATPPKVTNPGRTLTNTIDGKIDSAEFVRSLSAAEIENCLRRGLASTDPVERDLLLSQVLSQVTPENAKTMGKVFESMAKTHEIDPYFDRFMFAWARVDGPSAMAYGQTGAGGSPYSAVKGWAAADPEAAMAYLEETQLFDRYHESYLDGVIASDLELAQSLIANMAPKYRDSSISSLAKALKNDPDAMLSWADRTINAQDPDPDFIEKVLHQVGYLMSDGPAFADWLERNAASPYLTTNEIMDAARKWGETDPRAALAWVDRLSASDPRVDPSVLSSVVRDWSDSDPAGAMAWVERNLDDPRVESDMVGSVLGNLAKDDPQAAANWIEQRFDSGIVTNDVAASVVGGWVETAPDDALRWAESLPENLKPYSYYWAARNVPEDRLDDYNTWLTAAGPDKRFDLAREELSERLVDQDALKALETATTITDPERSERATIKAVSRIMQEDPDAVKLWLPDSGLPDDAQLRILLKDPNL